METNILLLLKDDIKLTSIAYILHNIGWDAHSLTTNNAIVIFNLMGIENTDDTFDFYHGLIENPNVDPAEIYEKLKSLV